MDKTNKKDDFINEMGKPIYSKYMLSDKNSN